MRFTAHTPEGDDDSFTDMQQIRGSLKKGNMDVDLKRTEENSFRRRPYNIQLYLYCCTHLFS